LEEEGGGSNTPVSVSAVTTSVINSVTLVTMTGEHTGFPPPHVVFVTVSVTARKRLI